MGLAGVDEVASLRCFELWDMASILCFRGCRSLHLKFGL